MAKIKSKKGIGKIAKKIIKYIFILPMYLIFNTIFFKKFNFEEWYKDFIRFLFFDITLAVIFIVCVISLLVIFIKYFTLPSIDIRILIIAIVVLLNSFLFYKALSS